MRARANRRSEVHRASEVSPMGGRTGFGDRPALLVVDLSIAFTDPASPVGAEVDEVIEANRRLIAAARRGNRPIFFLTVGFSPAEAETANVFLQKGPGMLPLVAGSELVKVDPRLAPRPDEPVLRKQFPSAFFGTPLAAMLEERRADTAVVTGLSTSGCVRATVVDALSHGYRVVVPREAVGDRDRAAHEQSLFDMDLKYADVVALDEVLSRLERVPVRQ